MAYSIASIISIAALLIGWQWNIEWMWIIGFMATMILAWFGVLKMIFVDWPNKGYEND